MSAIACTHTNGSSMEVSKVVSTGIMKNLGPSAGVPSAPPPLPSLPPSSSNSVLGVSGAGHGHSHHTNSQTTTTTTLLLDANGKKKKKSHLSRDELARVCQHGDVTFEPYNGSSYMIAVRSQEERKSLIGYRCDWNGCGYMNARVERMFGHIRSQHPEAPTVKKLVPTTGGASPVTNTITTATTGNTGSAHCSTTQSNTLTGTTGHADSKSTRLSLRSSSSLSNASSSITSPIPSLATLSAPPSSPPPPSLTCTVFSSPTTFTTTTTTSSTSNSTSLTTLVTSNTPTSNVDDNNNSGNSNSNTKHLFQQRLLLRKLSNYNSSTVTPTTTPNKCSPPLNSSLTENSCSRLVNLLQQRRRNSLATGGGPEGSNAINSQSTKPISIKQEIVDDEAGEKEKNLTNQNCSRIKEENEDVTEFKCNEPIRAETDTAQSITDQSASNIAISADRSDEQSPENIMQQLKTITNGACCPNSSPSAAENVPHCTVQPSPLCPSLEQSKAADPVAPSINTDPSTAELEMLDMEIESLLQLNNNSATDSAAVTVGNTNSQKKSVTELPPPLPDGALANLTSPVGSESKNYSLNPHHPHSNHHYSNSQLSPFIGVDSPHHQQPIQQNRPVASLPNGYQHPAPPSLPPPHHQSHPHPVPHHQQHVHQHHLSSPLPSLSHHSQPHPHSHPLHPHPQSHHQKFYSQAPPLPLPSQQYGAMAPQSNMIVNSELFNSNHQISNQHNHHNQHHEMLMHDLESQSNDSISSFATTPTTTTTTNKPTTAAMSPSGGGGGGGAGNRSKKKSCSSKNYIGKQNLFQEFQSVDVTKVRDNENQYIIALQKDSKIVGYRCDWPECEFLTCRKYVMVNHINGKHTNQRPYSCPLCNFNFVKRYFLKAHMHKVHKRRDSAALCNGKGSPDLIHGEDEDEENSKQSSKNSTHNKNLKNSGSFASSLTDDGSNFDDDLMVVKSENNGIDDGFGDEFGSHLKKRLKTDCYDQQLSSMGGGPGYYGNQAETTTTVQSGFVVNNNGGGGNYFDPYGTFEPHQSHMIHQQNPAACATAPIYDDGSQGLDIHLNNLMPNSGIQQAQRNFGYMDHSQQQQQTAYHHQRPNYCQNSFVGPRPNYPTMNCPVEMLTPPLTAGVITGSAGLGFPVSNNNNNNLDSAMGYSTNYQPNNQHQTINDEFNGLNTGFMINDEFLSPPSSISSISNGSSATSNNNNNNVPGSTTLGPLMNCRNVAQNGINPVLGPSNTPTSLANNSSFYLHTPSPSPSSLSHSPASANVANGQYKTNFSNSFDLAVGTSSTSSTTSQAVKSVNSSPINNNQNWFSSVSGPNQTSGYHPTGTGGQLDPSHQQPPPPFMGYSPMNNQPNYYTNSTPNADSAYLNQGSSDPSINNNLGGMLDVIPLIEYDYDMSLDDGLSANLASTITGANVVGQQTGSIKSGSYNPAAQGTVATNPASTTNPNLYHNNNNHSATTTVLDDCWNAW